MMGQAKRYVVESLDAENRAFIDKWLIDHSFRNIRRLQEELRERGLQIGLYALRRYGTELHSQTTGRSYI